MDQSVTSWGSLLRRDHFCGRTGFLLSPQTCLGARDNYAVDRNGIVKSWASTGEIYQENESSVEYPLPMYEP